jgi:hypothetical protein
LIYVKGRSTGKSTIAAGTNNGGEHENGFENSGSCCVDIRMCGVVFRLAGPSKAAYRCRSIKPAQKRVYITRGYAVNAIFVEPGTWDAVRAYYFAGPWSGPGYSYTGWADYAARNGIGCTPGTAIKGGDSIMYNCQ